LYPRLASFVSEKAMPLERLVGIVADSLPKKCLSADSLPRKGLSFREDTCDEPDRQTSKDTSKYSSGASTTCESFPELPYRSTCDDLNMCHTATTDTCDSTFEDLPELRGVTKNTCFTDDDDDLPGLPSKDQFSRRTLCSMIGNQSLATSGRWFAEPTQTLMFFDWDDTLFPTTELFGRWGITSDQSRWGELCLSDDQQHQLDIWEDAVYQFLCVALSRSERVSIVTNSRRPWVTDTVERFAPRLRPLFDREDCPHVVYAREVFEGQQRNKKKRLSIPKAFDCSSNPAKNVNAQTTQEEHTERCTAWKYAAMQQEAASFYSQYPNQTWKNIFSVGDMEYELYAFQDLDFQRRGPSRENLRTKSIILPKNMSISFMTVMWQWSKIVLPLQVFYDGDFDLDFTHEVATKIDWLAEHVRALNVPEFLSLDLPDELTKASGMNQILTEEECGVFSKALDELAILVQDALDY